MQGYSKKKKKQISLEISWRSLGTLQNIMNHTCQIGSSDSRDESTPKRRLCLCSVYRDWLSETLSPISWWIRRLPRCDLVHSLSENANEQGVDRNIWVSESRCQPVNGIVALLRMYNYLSGLSGI